MNRRAWLLGVFSSIPLLGRFVAKQPLATLVPRAYAPGLPSWRMQAVLNAAGHIVTFWGTPLSLEELQFLEARDRVQFRFHKPEYHVVSVPAVKVAEFMRRGAIE